MKSSYKLAIWLLAGLLFQASIYFYLDRVLFAPATSFQVSAVTEARAVIDGQTYYSRNKRYMAVVKDESVEIYATSPKSLLRSIPLNQQKVSYFKWLEDRDLALMAVYGDTAKDAAKVVLTQINPYSDGYRLSATIDKLPGGSKITDVAYSTATNVIYMQVLVANGPAQYRVYRTDANQDLTRVYLSGSRIGRIGVLFDQDSLIYDNLAEGIVYVRNGDGSWRVISPYGAKYNLVGVDGKNTIYLAKVNAQGLAETVFKGKLKVGFELDRTLTKPTDVRFLTMDGTEAPVKK